jgi:hypothetical protein
VRSVERSDDKKGTARQAAEDTAAMESTVHRSDGPGAQIHIEDAGWPQMEPTVERSDDPGAGETERAVESVAAMEPTVERPDDPVGVEVRQPRERAAMEPTVERPDDWPRRGS